MPLESFHDGLSLLDPSGSGHLGALLDAVLLKKVLANVKIELVPFSRNFHKFSDHTQTLRAVERRVLDLRLEGETLDHCHVEIFHLQQLGDRLHSILEGEDCFGCCIAEPASKQGLVLGQVFWEFIPELKSLVKLDFGVDVCSNDRDRQHVCEILRQ